MSKQGVTYLSGLALGSGPGAAAAAGHVCYAGNRFGPLAVDDDEEVVAASDLAVVVAADQQGSDLRHEGRQLAASMRSEIAAMELMMGEPCGSGHSWQDMRAWAVKLLAPLEADGF